MLIDEVIDNIALLAAQRNVPSYLEAYFYIGFSCCPPLRREWEMYGLNWEVNNKSSKAGSTCGVALRPSQEKIEELNQRIYDRGNAPPRLSQEQIQEIVSDYPFHLPIELYRLYQRANGIFPIGLGNKDWKSFDNFFTLYLSQQSECLLPLEEAMTIYRSFFKYGIDLRLFPILSFENGDFWAVMGSDEQQDHSPIYLVLLDESQPKMVCSNLVELLSTCVEE